MTIAWMPVRIIATEIAAKKETTESKGEAAHTKYNGDPIKQLHRTY